MNQRSTVAAADFEFVDLPDRGDASEEASKADPVGAGGDVTLSPGIGKPSGSIIFRLADGREMVRFDHDGKAYVRGEQVDDNQDIYLHFRRWLRLAHVVPAEEGEPTGDPNAGRQQSEPLGAQESCRNEDCLSCRLVLSDGVCKKCLRDADLGVAPIDSQPTQINGAKHDVA